MAVKKFVKLPKSKYNIEGRNFGALLMFLVRMKKEAPVAKRGNLLFWKTIGEYTLVYRPCSQIVEV